MEHLTAMSSARACLTEMINKYKGKPHIEIECHLGHIVRNEGDTGYMFDTNLTEEFFDTIHTRLSSNPGWGSTVVSETLDMFSGTKRLTIDQTTNARTVIEKKKLALVDFELRGTPFDLRISVCAETPKPETSFAMATVTSTRRKMRTRFVHKIHSFDVTTVHDSETSSTKMEVELEVDVSALTIPADHAADSTLLKVLDLVNFCESLASVSAVHYFTKL